MRFAVVSAFTKGTQYEDEAKELKASLDRFGIQYAIYPYESSGDWSQNTRVKPFVLLKAAKEFPDSALVWLDADAIVLEYPTLFDELDCDVCASLQPEKAEERRRVQSGTLFFNNTARAMRVLERWAKNTRKYKDWDQLALYKALSVCAKRCDIKHLPREYITMAPMNPRLDDKPHGVIWHKQRSRKVRSGEATV